MIAPFVGFRLRVHLSLLLAFSFFLILACAGQQTKKTELFVVKHPKYKKLLSENKKLLDLLESQEGKTAEIKLRILERDAQIKELKDRLDLQQKMLDEAILEVVRAKAKLRSLESKAEAASEMAEAEIAIKALKVQLAGRGEDPEVAKAEQLLKMSVQEFQNENYGGTLYLISQAKGHIKAGQLRLGGRTKLKPVQGEVLFAQPLPLQVLKTSNLREGPDLESDILATLEEGTPLIGFSYKGQWVRVTREDGSSGWIFQTLVGGR